MRRILVTGGTGFLGSALVRRLISLGHFVRVIDNEFRSSIDRLKSCKDQIDWVKGDIRDPKAVLTSMENIDTVIHLAAINGTKFFYERPDLVLDVGVRGILNVLDGCKKWEISDLIVASSSEVYQTPLKIPTDEKEPLKVPDVSNPRYSYGGSKIITELLAMNYQGTPRQRTVIFRPHNVYGPDMGGEHVLPELIVKILKSIKSHPSGPLPLEIQGSGHESRCFIHIDDMVDGIVLLMESGKHRQIYHVGNPEEISMADLAQKLAAYFGRNLALKPGPLSLGSTLRRCPSIEKIKQLGFSPKISLDQGLASIVEWYRKNHKK